MSASRLLAIDTSTFTASVAVMVGDAVVAHGEVVSSTHSERLLTLVDEVLGRAGVAAADLDAVACGAGPGSFTGLRIGLATAKGLAFATGKPLVMVSSLAALAGGHEGLVFALLDAKKQEVYAGLYRGGVLVGTEVVLPPPALATHVRALAGDEPVVVVGNGALAYPDAAAACGRVLADARPTPDASWIAALALPRIGSGDNVLTAEPTYIRMDVATPPKRRS